MAKKVWSISTTLRNPERLRDFLLVLKDMEGKNWNRDTQIEFQIKLIQNRVYGLTNQFLNDLSTENKKKFEDLSYKLSFQEAKEIFLSKDYEDPAMRGKNSYKPLEKMGLSFIKDRKIFITGLSEYLLKENYDLGEFFFRSFLKWQYPNPFSRDFQESDGYNIKPFIGTLHLINEVNKICQKHDMTVKGISKIEFQIFALSLINYSEIKQQAEKLIDFRKKYEKLKEYSQKRDYAQKYAANNLSDFQNASYNNLKDYADNAIRYFRMTRYIYIRGGGFYIDLEPRRKTEINKLLETDNASANQFTSSDYLKFMSDINLPELPWENIESLNKIYNSIIEDINNSEKTLNIELTKYKDKISDLDNLKNKIEELREYRKKIQNRLLKINFEDENKIRAAITSLKKHPKIRYETKCCS